MDHRPQTNDQQGVRKRALFRYCCTIQWGDQPFKEDPMIVVRDIFPMENGKHLFAAAGINYRLLADLVGDSYTFVLETTAANLAEWESNMRDSMTDEWRRWYQTVTPLCESGKREIFTVVE